MPVDTAAGTAIPERSDIDTGKQSVSPGPMRSPFFVPGGFIERFFRFFSARDFDVADIERGVAIHRKEAAKILLGIHWQFIPKVTCERRPVVQLKTLLMLCCCLDDEQLGASPGRVTDQQLLMAWIAAGHENWLKRCALRRLQAQAHFCVLAEHQDLLGAAIAVGLSR
jgi:hypothetical protein